MQTATLGYSPVLSSELQYEIEQFLYLEAALLDERRFEEWLELFHSGAFYTLVMRENQISRDARRQKMAATAPMPLMEESLANLRSRVARLRDGTAWVEEPPSRTRRLLTNVRISKTEPGSLAVASNFIVYVSRRERDELMFTGSRKDVLVRGADDRPWAFARRDIRLEQSTLLAPAISIFL